MRGRTDTPAADSVENTDKNKTTDSEIFISESVFMIETFQRSKKQSGFRTADLETLSKVRNDCSYLLLSM